MQKKVSNQKGSKEQVSNKNKKTKIMNRVHHNKEIISEEELNRRGGITGNKRVYFLMYLKFFFEGRLHLNGPYNLITVAKYIYDKKELYVNKQDGYKLMEFSSIETDLNALSKFEQQQLEDEKIEEELEAERYKNRNH